MKNLLSEKAKAIIRTYAPLSEQHGTLHLEILQLAYNEGWFKLFVPQHYHGEAMLLPEILRLEEALAAEDGSLAWTVTLCSGASWFAGFLHPELAATVFADPKVCFAGSGAIGGTARLTAAGYLINGHWKYASGALHATIFTANCIIQDDEGQDILDQQGNPQVKSFILKRDEVAILSGWSYFGLVATGSHAFTVTDTLVPENRTFEINKNIQVDLPGFDYPFLQLAETTLAVNSAGMARHFLELAESSFITRSGQKRYTDAQRSFFMETLRQQKEAFTAVRDAFYNAFDSSWAQLLTDGAIDSDTLNQVSRTSRELAHCALQVTDKLFPYCGLEAAKKETEINRVWRDIHTASQHSLLTFSE